MILLSGVTFSEKCLLKQRTPIAPVSIASLPSKATIFHFFTHSDSHSCSSLHSTRYPQPQPQEANNLRLQRRLWSISLCCHLTSCCWILGNKLEHKLIYWILSQEREHEKVAILPSFWGTCWIVEKSEVFEKKKKEKKDIFVKSEKTWALILQSFQISLISYLFGPLLKLDRTGNFNVLIGFSKWSYEFLFRLISICQLYEWGNYSCSWSLWSCRTQQHLSVHPSNQDAVAMKMLTALFYC